MYSMQMTGPPCFVLLGRLTAVELMVPIPGTVRGENSVFNLLLLNWDKNIGGIHTFKNFRRI